MGSGTLRLSHSQIKTWRRCRLKWYFRYVLGLQPKQTIDKIEMGNYGHRLLEAFYKGEDWRKASEEYWKEQTQNMFEEEIDAYEKIRHDIEIIMARYVDHYKHQLEEWDVLGVEQPFEVRIPTHTGRSSQTTLCGIFDLVIQEKRNGNIWLVDHKITSRDVDKTEEDLILDPQVNYYLWALNQLVETKGDEELPVQGVIYNMVRSKVPSKPRLLKDGKAVSKAKNIDTDVETYLATLQEYGLNPKDYVDILDYIKENGRPFFAQLKVHRTKPELDAIEKELYDISKDIRHGEIFRHEHRDCSWDCKQFRELCIMDFKGLDTEDYINLNYDIREGYDEDEEKDEGIA